MHNRGESMEDCIILNADSPSVRFLIDKDKRLAKVISKVGDIKIQLNKERYSFLVHEIIEQMLSIKAGAKIYERLLLLCKGNIAPEVIINLSDEQLKNIGTSSAKVKYIKGLTSAIIDKRLVLEDLENKTDIEVIKKLTSIRGIGTWTAKMYLIFVLNREDVLPYEDGAFLQSYRWLYNTEDVSVESIKKRCRKWKPYSSIASRYMYKALDLGFTKERFHLYRE